MMGMVLVLSAAAISIVIAGLGTVYGTRRIALGSTGYVAERPREGGLAIILSALPSSQGIYGFLGAILILQKVGLLGGELATVSMEQGWMFVMAALPVGLLGLTTGIGQGQVLHSGLKIIAKDPGNIGQTIILGVLMESMAVFGLLISIIVINGLTI